jgi:hypothetical protein
MANDPPGISAPEIRDLRRVAGIMIPADDTYQVPAADDPAIIADMVRTLGRDTADIRAALAMLSSAGTFGALDDPGAAAVTMQLLAGSGQAVRTLGRVVLSAYYRDDRVMRSLGREARPPFPQGHTLPEGDWSLLEAVKRRPQLWRDDRG